MSESPLPVWIAVPAGLLLISGGLITLIGATGLLRLRDFHARMHPPTMGMGLGTTCVLVSSMMVSSSVLGRPVFHELAIGLFILLSTPVSAITLMSAAISRTRDGHSARDEVDSAP
jgi:multicomponent K+:H+ antiporter subunit G